MLMKNWVALCGFLGIAVGLIAVADSGVQSAGMMQKEQQVLALASATVQTTHTKDSLDKIQANLKNKKAIILDVREQSEWDDGHLKDAQFLPLSRLKAGIPATDLAKLLPKDKTIYAHCGSGRRVLDAAEILQKAGYKIEPLKTGYTGLVKAGFEKAAK